MYKVFALIINFVAALTLSSIFQSGVTLNVETPGEVVAGSVFEVKVTIQKGDLESFSRLQQSLPAGLTAISYLSSNADFTFEEKRVRMIWLRLPKDNDFTVVYKIKVDERLKGAFDIKGKFSYIEDNERKSVTVESNPITILPSPTIDPSLIVDINDFEQQVVPYISPANAEPQIACIRQTPSPGPGGESYTVNLLINKAAKQKFAKVEEIIPAGYKAVSIDPKEAIFAFKNGTAKFLWMNLPADPFFIVSYKLVAIGKSPGPPQPDGKFSYLEEEKTISIDIQQTDRDLTSIGPNDIGSLLSSLSTQRLLAKDEPKIKEGDKVIPAFTIVKPENSKKKNRNVKLSGKELKKNLPYLLEPESGVYYRVQIAAGHRPVEIERYFIKYNLDKEVRKEYHDGWHKYSIGSFGVYKDARDYRVHIWNTTIIDDAFVSAYNTGKRITVQEALMIANQEWYK